MADAPTADILVSGSESENSKSGEVDEDYINPDTIEFTLSNALKIFDDYPCDNYEDAVRTLGRRIIQSYKEAYENQTVILEGQNYRLSKALQDGLENAKIAGDEFAEQLRLKNREEELSELITGNLQKDLELEQRERNVNSSVAKVADMQNLYNSDDAIKRLTISNEKLTAANNDLTAQNKQWETHLRDVNSLMKGPNQDVRTLRINQLQDENVKLVALVDDLRNEQIDLEGELTALKKKKAVHFSASDANVGSQITNLTNQNSDLKKQVEDMRAQLKSLTTDERRAAANPSTPIVTPASDIAARESDKKTLEEENASLQKMLDSATVENKKFRAAYEKSKANEKKLEDNIQGYKDHIDRLVKQQADAPASWSAKKLGIDSDEMKTVLGDYQILAEQLAQRVTANVVLIEQLNMQIKNLKEENEKLKRKSNKRQSHEGSKDGTDVAHKKEVAGLNKQITDLQALLGEKEDNKARLESRQKKIDELKAEVKQLKDTDAQASEQRRSDLSNRIDSPTTQLEDAQDALNSKDKRKFKGLQEQVKQLDQQVKKAQKQVNASNKALEDQDSQHKADRKTKGEVIKDLEAKLKPCEEEKAAITQFRKVGHTQAEFEHLKDKITDLEQKLKGSDPAVNALDFSDLQKKNKLLEGKLKDYLPQGQEEQGSGGGKSIGVQMMQTQARIDNLVATRKLAAEQSQSSQRTRSSQNIQGSDQQGLSSSHLVQNGSQQTQNNSQETQASQYSASSDDTEMVDIDEEDCETKLAKVTAKLNDAKKQLGLSKAQFISINKQLENALVQDRDSQQEKAKFLKEATANKAALEACNKKLVEAGLTTFQAEEYAISQKQLDELEDEIAKQQTALDEFLIKIKDLEELIKKLENEKEVAEKQVALLTKKCAERDEDVIGLELEREELRGKIRALEEKLDALKDLESHLEDCNKKRKKLENKVAKMNRGANAGDKRPRPRPTLEDGEDEDEYVGVGGGPSGSKRVKTDASGDGMMAQGHERGHGDGAEGDYEDASESAPPHEGAPGYNQEVRHRYVRECIATLKKSIPRLESQIQELNAKRQDKNLKEQLKQLVQEYRWPKELDTKKKVLLMMECELKLMRKKQQSFIQENKSIEKQIATNEEVQDEIKKLGITLETRKTGDKKLEEQIGQIFLAGQDDLQDLNWTLQDWKLTEKKFDTQEKLLEELQRREKLNERQQKWLADDLKDLKNVQDGGDEQGVFEDSNSEDVNYQKEYEELELQEQDVDDDEEGKEKEEDEQPRILQRHEAPSQKPTRKPRRLEPALQQLKEWEENAWHGQRFSARRY